MRHRTSICPLKQRGQLCSNASLCNNVRAEVDWKWFSFDQLSPAHLYATLELRQSVFIVEQGVPYRDIDRKDLFSMHLLGFSDGELISYLRALPKDIFEPGYCSFGRVVVHKSARRAGIGRELVRKAINHMDTFHGECPIKISSQLYLKEFYASYGFSAIGESYIEDMIPHIAMVRGRVRT